MSPVEIGVSFERGHTQEPLRVPDGVLAEAFTPVGRALAYVVPRTQSSGSLYERTGFLFPGQEERFGEDVVGEGLFFGGDMSAIWVLMHPNKWRERTQATKIVYRHSYDTHEGTVVITITAIEEIRGKKVPSSRAVQLTPAFQLAPASG